MTGWGSVMCVCFYRQKVSFAFLVKKKGREKNLKEGRHQQVAATLNSRHNERQRNPNG